ncbi:MAG TPA: hypothetical protein H9815_06345 [Candidatus Ruania gallistercoris]|uniref:Uncharacterized protein n=1 Tax=Candidatus Ruania gallistercoris TaxID=2838746 RepID=A0A9D2J4I0_9MICO|nr:hypothetical protein [Candidatus Ruania gallistercoris]
MSQPYPYQPAPGPPAGYRTLYGPFALGGLLLSTTQLYAQEVTEGYPERLTLWSLMSDPNWAGVSAVSLLLIFLLVGLAVGGAVRAVRTVALPIAVAVLSLLGAVMLMAKIGYSDPAPPFDDGGAMLLTLAWAGVVLGIVHTVHVLIWRRRSC